MVGCDLPSGGSGSPPSAVARPRKRKRSDAAAEDGTAPPRRATRSTAGLDVNGAVQWARRAAAGSLWAVRGRNRGPDVDEEQMGAVILAVRHARSELEPDDPGSPYAKKRIPRQGTRSSGRLASGLRHLSSYLSMRKHIGIHPVQYQASVPEWGNTPSENDKDDYKTDNDTSQKMGTVIVLPLNVEPWKTRKSVNDKCICSHPGSEACIEVHVKENAFRNVNDKCKCSHPGSEACIEVHVKENAFRNVNDKCKCSHPGSEACIEVHIKEARSKARSQLGKNAFRNCGLDSMGEQVLKLWTAADKKKLDDIERSVPHNKHESFIKIASKRFSSKRTVDLAKYYYNVFLPRRLARLTRADATHAIDVSTDDEGSDQDDDNYEHCSEQKSGKSQSSLKRFTK